MIDFRWSQIKISKPKVDEVATTWERRYRKPYDGEGVEVGDCGQLYQGHQGRSYWFREIVSFH